MNVGRDRPRRRRPVIAALLLLAVAGAAVVAVARSGPADRNAYQLPGTPYFNNGYEWWWHSFVAHSRTDGSPQSFFVEYFVINPGAGGSEVVRGGSGRRPSYAKVMVGAWGEHKVLLESYVPITAFAASDSRMDVRLGANEATDSALHGEVVGTPEGAVTPQRLAWTLRAEKVVPFDLGFSGGRLFQWLGAFDMLWSVPGMQTRYSGTVEWNGTVYDVDPAASFGYQDKNWGRDYTTPWYWLSCNRFVSRLSGQAVPSASLDVGGGTPRIWGLSLGHDKLLIGLRYHDTLWRWNFNDLLDPPAQVVDVQEQADRISWRFAAENRHARIEIAFTDPTADMLQLVYENPAGQVPLARLWNGGTASGSVKLYRKAETSAGGWELVDWLEGGFGQGEYGIPAASP
jgi:hypothetical protein